MKKIAVITATRAEYGLLSPLMRKIEEDEYFELDLIVTGGHLSAKQGYTIDAIREDGFLITHEIPILEDNDTPYDVSLTMANAIKGFAKCFRDDRPDMAVILGDRTEMLGVASAAVNEGIPIVHISGGEVTMGAVDDWVRHALTKMSYLHFTSTDIYRRRVIQLGENPGRVFNVGALAVENILNQRLLSEKELRLDLGIPTDMPYAVVTFHPVTLERESLEGQIMELYQAMDVKSEYFYVITGANTDTGGDRINRILKIFTLEHDNAVMVTSLGTQRYLSALKYAAFVLGNSSSGITEAPILGTPTVNVGDRQKGRELSDTILCCCCSKDEIVAAMERVKGVLRKGTHIFGDGGTSGKIAAIIKDHFTDGEIDLKKEFYDYRQDGF